MSPSRIKCLSIRCTNHSQRRGLPAPPPLHCESVPFVQQASPGFTAARFLHNLDLAAPVPSSHLAQQVRVDPVNARLTLRVASPMSAAPPPSASSRKACSIRERAASGRSSVFKDYDLFPDVHSPHVRNPLAQQHSLVASGPET